MNAILQELAQTYSSALEHYLSAASEASLRGAYELGRRAIAEGLGVLDMSGIHQKALAAILTRRDSPEERGRILAAASDFFSETLSPFEMALRGFQEANSTLRRNLEDLLSAEEELCQQNQRLADAHQAVAAERQRYRELFEFAPDGYLLTDVAGTILEANSAAANMFRTIAAGPPPAAAAGAPDAVAAGAAEPLAEKQLRSFVAAEDRGAFDGLLERIRSGHEGETLEGELRMTPPAGRPLPVAVKLSVIRETEGRASGLRWLLRDVTERKRVEEERALLQIRERVARAEAEGARRLEFLAEASKLLASSLDFETGFNAVARLAVPYLADWCFIWVTPDGEPPKRLRGAFSEPLRDDDVADVDRAEDDAPAPPECVWNVLQGSAGHIVPAVSEAWLETLAARPEQLSVLKRMGLQSAMTVPMVTQGRTCGCIVLLSAHHGRRYVPADLILAEDLAHRCALAFDNARLYRQGIIERDRAEKASRAKDEFVAILSHELRNPLMPILGWTRVFRNHPTLTKDGMLAEGVRSLERNAQNIERIVEDCLDMARISERKIRLERETIDLNEVCEAAIEATREMGHTKGMKFVVQLSAGPLRVWGDRTRLQQVVMNLLTNAIRYSEAAGLIAVSSEARDSLAEVRVQDSGIGIDPAFMQQIFEPFRQGSSAWLTSESGLGLGLAVVRQIVQMHDGQISAESAGTGCGSTFTVRLPLVEPQPAEAEVSVTPVEEALANPLRVLVIEDSRDILALMKIELEALGYSVLTAVDGKSGLELALRARPDAIVSDIRMPGIDGYELIRRIRRDPEIAGIPAVALTGFGMKQDMERARRAGYDAHMIKPVDAGELSKLIRSLVRDRARTDH